jgi:hypothetical protein
MAVANKDTGLLTFIRDYESKIAHILGRPSGKHAPDKAALERWVYAQASPRRRRAAQNLASNLVYISHRILIGYCRSLVQNMYTDPEKSIPSLPNKLKWFVGEKTKSSYFISLICYHFVQEAGYRLPDVILTDNFDLDACDNSTIFVFDDMSYSGSQLFQLLEKIHLAAARRSLQSRAEVPVGDANGKPKFRASRGPPPINLDEAKFTVPDIRLGICVMTGKSEETLKTFKYPNRLKIGCSAYASSPFPNPYKRYFVRIIPDLEKILSPQDYTDCIVYFNSYSQSPPCICYFDHKVADGYSTFLHVLRFGIVPPTPSKEMNYSEIYRIQQYRRDKQYLTQDKEICDKQILKTQFIPFITGCHIEEAYIEKLKSLNYNVLMMGLEKTDEPYDEYRIEGAYRNVDKHLNLFKYKNSVESRCPHSWYKDGYFAEGGTRKRKHKKLTRSKKTRHIRRKTKY